MSQRSDRIALLRHPSRLLVTKGIDIGYMFGVPYKAREGAMIIDVDREVTSAKSLTGDLDRKRGFVLSRGMIMCQWAVKPGQLGAVQKRPF